MKTSSKNISKRVAEIMKTATPRQKALVICKDWVERKTFGKEILLNQDEIDAIMNSLTDEETKVYNKWVRTFNVYLELNPLLGIVYKEYQTQAEKIIGLFQVWEAYNLEENHLNLIYQDLLDSKNTKALETFGNSLKYIKYPNAELKRDEDGYIEVCIDKLYEEIEDEMKLLWTTYATAKAMVIATEDFTRRTKSKAFMPELTAGAIEDIKMDYSLFVAPKYSRKELQERIDKGVRVTKEERKRAIYPYYEEIQATDEFISMFKERIKNMEREVYER